MLGVLAAFFDPAFENSDLLRREVLVGKDRRHAARAWLGGDALVDEACLRFARNERYVAVAIRGSSFKRIEAQTSHALFGVLAVALETVFGKYGAYVTVVIKSRFLSLGESRGR